MNPPNLICHAASPARVPLEIAVTVERMADGGLRLDYRLSGAIAQLLLPAPYVPQACDGLWQHTCCEAFVATPDSPAYREFNLSPSGCWAAYAFDDYRQRDTRWQPEAPPRIDFRSNESSAWLSAEIPADLLPTGPLRLGLTSVIETQDGHKSYWALAHAAAQPDFHLAASFTLLLP